MPLDLHLDCRFVGPALPEPFVKGSLEGELNRRGLLRKATGTEGAVLAENWTFLRRKLGALVSHGGGLRVQNHVLEPLLPAIGYASIQASDDIPTREGPEAGGVLLATADGSARLRAWCVDLDADLDAPAQRGEAYRFSHARVAQRVLLATGERVGLLTNGAEIRLLISDPARVDSHLAISLDPHWKRRRDVPDSFRLLLALASPPGMQALPEIIDQARLQQAKVTKDLREQARNAIRDFIQELLEHPENQPILEQHPDKATLARQLWHEGLITVYRLLFILKLESTDDPARSFSFASTALWRGTFSPTVALAPIARRILDHGAPSGRILQDGLRALFRMLSEGLQCSELNVRPMAGALFAQGTTPLLEALAWTDTAVARLLDNLLWTRPARAAASRDRVHYGALDVEDLGRVYEALLELEPGIAPEPMCRLRRAKLEVVVPAAQGLRYKTIAPPTSASTTTDTPDAPETDDEPDDPDAEASPKKTKVLWIEDIPAGRFFLRVGLGRKATGSFYTPHSFVRFLVRETLGPLVQRVSPATDPVPRAILGLKVIDKAMGSGHFLVEACRFLGDALYEAARRCDELAAQAEKLAEAHRNAAVSDPAQSSLANAQLLRASSLRQRVLDLPDPDDELLRYLPSRSVEGPADGFSHAKAVALCRRMVAVHCLYGVDKNPLAVELAKLALWIESHAEGLPLTFLDHRLLVGDSLTGPFFHHLLTYPGSKEPLDDLFTQGLASRLASALAVALGHVRALESSVGLSPADIEAKLAAKQRLDDALQPFKTLAAAWSGGVMLGTPACNDTAYAALAKHLAEHGSLPDNLALALGTQNAADLQSMILKGNGLPNPPPPSPSPIPALPFDLAFPEVFYPSSNPNSRSGFDADLGNPPWDAIQFKSKEFLAAFDLAVLEAPTKRERESSEARLLSIPTCRSLFDQQAAAFEEIKRANDALYEHQKVEIDGDLAGRQLDAFRVFMERAYQVLKHEGKTGVVVPSAFHANEGTTGIRRLYINAMQILCCYSYINRRKLFEIDSRFKFSLVIAQRGATTSEIPCAFYLESDEWLFGNRPALELRFTVDFVKRTGGEYLTFIEPKSPFERDILARILLQGQSLAGVFKKWSLTPNTSELPMLGRGVFVPINQIEHGQGDPRQPRNTANLNSAGYAPLHEGKTFFQFDDHHGESLRYAVRLSGLSERPRWLRLPRFYRLAYRAIAASSNERTGIAAILPPGTVNSRKAASDVSAHDHPTWNSLWVAGVFNSYSLDFALRAMVQTDVGLFIVKRLTAPNTTPLQNSFLSHGALRLTCNHAGYAPLWAEQVGDAWREDGVRGTWPVLAGDDARWAVRSAIDAVVADAYGLTREQYEHVLGTFSHASYPAAPRRCLEAFDELRSMGLEAFMKKHDPYWYIPLNENLPQPVIDIPLPPGSIPEPPRPTTGELFPIARPDLAPQAPRRRPQKSHARK